jgi:predicted ABC-type ATPase
VRHRLPKQPTAVVIAGPNGAGKSTAAPFLLKQALGILEFVNADQIAVGLASAKVSFAFESTLSSRTFALFLTRC